MKTQLLKFMAACSVVCITGIALQAQSYKTAANVPFAFHVGKVACPAGRYQFSQSSPNMYQIMRNEDSGRSIILVAGPQTVDGSAKPRLIFNQYGSQYFLSEVWSATGKGTHLNPGSIEKEVRQNAQEASLNIPLVAHR